MNQRPGSSHEKRSSGRFWERSDFNLFQAKAQVDDQERDAEREGEREKVGEGKSVEVRGWRII